MTKLTIPRQSGAQYKRNILSNYVVAKSSQKSLDNFLTRGSNVSIVCMQHRTTFHSHQGIFRSRLLPDWYDQKNRRVKEGGVNNPSEISASLFR